MSKLFINTILQYGGEPNSSEKVVILNTISKHINKKMKILEYKHKIKLKLSQLPIDNWDSLPKSVGIQTFAKIDGPLKGQIPIYTKTNLNIPTPSISSVTAGVPITPFGPVVGVPALAINPFGVANSFDERVNRANKYLEIITQIDEQLDNLEKGLIDKSKVDTKYFEFVDLDEPDPIDDFKELFGVKEGYSEL